jgi:hypothetical protein
MKRNLTLQMLVIVGLTMLLSFVALNSAFAQNAPYSEEYMQQHDGGDRAEYLQEVEYDDPLMYVPPAN